MYSGGECATQLAQDFGLTHDDVLLRKKRKFVNESFNWTSYSEHDEAFLNSKTEGGLLPTRLAPVSSLRSAEKQEHSTTIFCSPPERPLISACRTYMKPARTKLGRRVRFADLAATPQPVIQPVYTSHDYAIDGSIIKGAAGFGRREVGGISYACSDCKTSWSGQRQRALTQGELDSLSVYERSQAKS
eukprot:TRINITY_DN8494_c0_g2_i1.p1 TRINITY_DN8494_c0_g2~~TRINITY_DN8494_c0_g2_i1.p1  ORF type:complete len:188 (-),score=12.85 TRINITY_DN8494_c0_g2_i1:179-742(-)